MKNSRSKFSFVMMSLIFFSVSVNASYRCPYAGPAEVENELQYQVEQYLIDIEVAFPSDDHDGLLWDCVVWIVFL